MPGQTCFQSRGCLTGDCRDNNAFRSLSPYQLNRHLQAVCGPDRLTHAYDLDIELRNSESSHLNQFVRGLECIQNGRQAQIEDTIECEHINTHGTFDTKYGSSANG